MLAGVKSDIGRVHPVLSIVECKYGLESARSQFPTREDEPRSGHSGTGGIGLLCGAPVVP